MDNNKKKLDSPSFYTIGWIAALSIERAAARALLDEEHDEPDNFHQHQSDTNSYSWGRIGQHNIVIASLPAGVYGTTSSATTATELVHSLPQVRFGLLVGIGGGIAKPDDGQDIRLGDVVVSQPDGVAGGVVQYDLGKAKANRVWERKGSLDKPPSVLLKALATLQSDHEIQSSRIPELLEDMVKRNPGMKRPKSNFTYQGSENDHLFDSSYDHAGGKTCSKCDLSHEVDREERDSTEPEIHYGIIASGNTLIKDAVTRDKLLEVTGHQCLCVEMEAAGLIDRFPCLVIRGICDYADSHKNDQWQRYAAATAAAFAVELLGYVPVRQVEESQRAIEILQSLEQKVDSLNTTIRRVDQSLFLDRLPFVEGALFNSHAEEHNPTCLPDTRVQLLEDINSWIMDPKSKSIFWLNGMAGTGKSTISRTISQQQLEKDCLGATFFFKRGETDRGNVSKIIPTLARQLSMYVPGMADLLGKVVDPDWSIAGKTLGEQFDKLIRTPLIELASCLSASTILVIVIDALDECDNDNYVKRLLSLFSRIETPSPLCLRVFITSRPELPIELGFHDINGTYEHVQLHRISQHIIEHDISIFLQHELDSIRHDFNRTFRYGQKLPMDWPGDIRLQKLILKTQPLFIAAATVCRFLNDTTLGSPDELLNKVVNSRSGGHISRLDQIYSSVLEQQIINRPESERLDVIESFRLIVGSIIISASPLSIKSLALLLNISAARIEAKVRVLQSVLDVPQELNSPVRILHLSFRDHLVHPGQKTTSPFWVDERATHRHLANRCLIIMQSALCANMCKLPFPGAPRSEVKDYDLQRYIPGELQYACLHWVYHCISTIMEVVEIQNIYLLLKEHLLRWLEVMSLLGRIKESSNMFQSLIGWLEGLRFDSFRRTACQELIVLIEDALRFIQINVPIIDEAPLQIYSSALVFTPRNSIVRQLFESNVPSWLSSWPTVEDDWGPCIAVLEGHTDYVCKAVFSHDSTMIASASGDCTIRIWTTKTGNCEHILSGHQNAVRSAAFSPDSSLLASDSDDETIRIWNIQTGECEKVLQCPRLAHNTATFSHDSKLLLALYFENSLLIWRTQTREFITLRGHTERINSFCLSHDSTRVVTCSDDETVRIWSTTGECENIITGHTTSVNTVMFSHDSQIVVSGSSDGEVRIWCSQTGECESLLQEHSELILYLQLSSDSQLIAVGYDDGIIQVWDRQTGTLLQTLEKNLAAPFMFSGDSTKIIFVSDDGNTIGIQDIATGQDEQVLKGHGGQIQFAVISHDFEMILTASTDRTVRIWNSNTQASEKRGPSYMSSPSRCVKISPKGDKVAFSDIYSVVQLWSLGTGEFENDLRPKTEVMELSPDLEIMACGSLTAKLELWGIGEESFRKTLDNHGALIWSADFSHDCKTIASVSPMASGCSATRIWQVESESCIRELNHKSQFDGVCFSPDSTMVALWDNKYSQEIWNVEKGTHMYTFTGDNHVGPVVFSDDCNFFASVSLDRTARVWSLSTGNLICTPHGRCSEVLSFTSDNRILVTDNGIIPIATESPLLLSHGGKTASQSNLPIARRGDTWIMLGNENFFWLPAECRGSKIAIRGDTVAVGCQSGRTIILKFDVDKIAMGSDGDDQPRVGHAC